MPWSRTIILWYEGPWSSVSSAGREAVGAGYVLRGGSSSFAAILTNSASDSACIFRITCPRWIFTVISLVPSSEAICLLSMPETTRLMTSRSRWSVSFVTLSQLGKLTLLLARHPVAIQSLVDCIQQVLVAERLGQEFDRTGFHGSSPSSEYLHDR